MNGLLKFGDNELSLYMTVTNITRSIMPARRLTKTTVPGMDGVLLADEGFDPVEITITANIKARSIREVMEQKRMLARMLYSTTPQKLIMPDDPDTYMLATYTGESELSRASKRPKIEMTFLCADPIAYGRDKSTTVDTTQTTINTGGTYKSWPTITVKPASGSSWRITNVTTGDYVLVYATFTGSQTLVLNMENQRCTINGTDHAVDVSSDFFALDGTQNMKVSSGTATVEWTERWL